FGQVGGGPGDSVADLAHVAIIDRWTPDRPDQRPSPDGSAPSVSEVVRMMLARAVPACPEGYRHTPCARACPAEASNRRRAIGLVTVSPSTARRRIARACRGPDQSSPSSLESCRAGLSA